MNRTRLALLAFAPLALVACGGDDPITIEGQWARTSPSMASMGAAYMDLTSSEGDQLVGVSVPASIAARAEIHEMVPADMAMDDSMDMGASEDDMDHSMDESMDDGEMEMDMGAMVMQQIMALDLPAGETVNLEPGGYHVMLIDLAEPLAEGDTFNVTLDFAEADDLTVEVVVRTEAP
ncbi:MAG: copper chaperone PCu(A)C [Ilumatobacteraceae bacterium]